MLDLSNAISRKRCKIGGKLVLITNRKSHMSFPSVPNSVTLDDLERRNNLNYSVISPKSVAFGADYVKVVEDTQIFLQQKCRPKTLVLAIYHLWRYWQGITLARVLKRGTPLSLSKFEKSAITWNQCKIGGNVALITSRKSYMSFRLVPKSVTLNDLERRSGRYIAFFH